MNEAIKEVLMVCFWLLWPVAVAFCVCFVRGSKAERRERREARRHG